MHPFTQNLHCYLSVTGSLGDAYSGNHSNTYIKGNIKNTKIKSVRKIFKL